MVVGKGRGRTAGGQFAVLVLLLVEKVMILWLLASMATLTTFARCSGVAGGRAISVRATLCSC